MTTLTNKLIADESGFIVSAELVLIATITVLGLVVGLTEVTVNLNNELEDVGSAFGSINQSFWVCGMFGHGGGTSGGGFRDQVDFCDHPNDIQCHTGISEGNNVPGTNW